MGRSRRLWLHLAVYGPRYRHTLVRQDQLCFSWCSAVPCSWLPPRAGSWLSLVWCDYNLMGSISPFWNAHKIIVDLPVSEIQRMLRGRSKEYTPRRSPFILTSHWRGSGHVFLPNHEANGFQVIGMDCHLSLNGCWGVSHCGQHIWRCEI